MKLRNLAVGTHLGQNDDGATPDNIQMQPGKPHIVRSAGAATLYGVDFGDANYTIGLTGADATTSTTISAADFTALANAHVDGGSLAVADRLRVVVLVNGQPLLRVAASATPTAGQFKTSGSSPKIVTLGTALAAGDVVVIYLYNAAPASMLASTALVANVMEKPAARDVMDVTVATIQVLEDSHGD